VPGSIVLAFLVPWHEPSGDKLPPLIEAGQPVETRFAVFTAKKRVVVLKITALLPLRGPSPSFAQIYRASLQRMPSPPDVLGSCGARSSDPVFSPITGEELFDLQRPIPQDASDGGNEKLSYQRNCGYQGRPFHWAIFEKLGLHTGPAYDVLELGERHTVQTAPNIFVSGCAIVTKPRTEAHHGGFGEKCVDPGDFRKVIHVAAVGREPGFRERDNYEAIRLYP
jgi:hypothetical protein